DKANRNKAIELVAAFTKSPKEVLDSYFATGSDYYRDLNGCVPAIAIQKPIDAMVEEKLIPQPVDASKYLALSYLPRPCSTESDRRSRFGAYRRPTQARTVPCSHCEVPI